jgi:hypothetical protein
MFSGEGEQFLRILFSNGSTELAGVNELQFCGLLCHCSSNLWHSMSNEIHCR